MAFVPMEDLAVDDPRAVHIEVQPVSAADEPVVLPLSQLNVSAVHVLALLGG